MALIVGLGNPGTRYAGTRHNAGFLVVEELARRWGASFRPLGRQAELARGEPPHAEHRLLKPTSFMNLSGRAVQAARSAVGGASDPLLVVHDDLDLPLGRLRFKRGGGAGGQKGVKDIIGRLGPDFDRLKVGIGRPPPRWTVENWVLSRFADDELELVDAVVAAAADGVEAWLAGSLDDAMNRVNGLDLRPSDADDAATPSGGEGSDAEPPDPGP